MINRSYNYISQVKFSFLYKVGTVATQLASIPLVLGYLGPERFGVWLVMLTLFNWVTLFDLGVGNELKNNIASKIASKDYGSISSSVTNSVSLFSGIIVTVFFVSFLFWFFLGDKYLSVIFNYESDTDLSNSTIFLLFFVFSSVLLNLINQICHGLQLSYLQSFNQFASSFVFFLSIFFFEKYFEPSLVVVVVGYGLAILLSSVVLIYYVFSKHSYVVPRFNKLDISEWKNIFNVGGKFFIIQVSVLLVFLVDKHLVLQLFGPAAVVSYEVIFKYFSLFTVMHALILNPLWPAYTNAYQLKEFNWIRRAMVKQLYLFVVIVFFVVTAALFAPVLIGLWVPTVVLNSNLVWFFGVFIIVSSWNNVFAFFVNAVGALNLQFYTSIIAALVNIPASIFLVRYLDFGTEGIVLASIFSLLFFAILGPIQVYRILKYEK